jgi:hypothetical protein
VGKSLAIDYDDMLGQGGDGAFEINGVPEDGRGIDIVLVTGLYQGWGRHTMGSTL